jgi:hypothetical protein
MGIANVAPNIPWINDFNPSTMYGNASFPVAAGGNVRLSGWGPSYGGGGDWTFDAARGYPSGRIVLNSRIAATMYQSKANVSAHININGLGTVYSNPTTEYSTAYSAWLGVVPQENSVWEGDWWGDNRNGATLTNFRLLDAWVEIQYADYPSQSGVGGDGVTTSPIFTMAAFLNPIGTGQQQYATWQLATDPGFGNVIHTTYSGYLASGWVYIDTPTLGPGTYYYRTTAVDAYGQGSGVWSATATVTVQYPAPPAPSVVAPAGGSTMIVPNPQLGATLVAAQNGQTQRAEWQLATDSGFSVNLRTITESTADLRISGATTEDPTVANLNLSNGVWYIRARAIDVYGQGGAYTAAQSFTVNTPPPPVPTAITPAAAATITTTNPVLGANLGQATSGRTSRAQWQLSKSSTFATGVITVTEPVGDLRASGATTEAVPTATKLDNGTWYLRALSIASDGSQSAYSVTQSFTVALPAPPTPTSHTPATGSTVTKNTPTLVRLLVQPLTDEPVGLSSSSPQTLGSRQT